MGLWNVPLANVFAAFGRERLVPWVLATSATAAFVSPLFVGALADQKMAPTRLLRWLAVLTGLTLTMTCLSLHWGLSDGLVLLCAQVQALVAMPVLKSFRQRFDPRRYNGASLLGLKGIVVKSHGSADELAFENALIRAYDAARNQLLDRVRDRIAHAAPLLMGAQAERSEPAVTSV